MSPEGRAAAETERDLRVRRAFLDASRLSDERLADHLAALPDSIASEVRVLLKLVAEDLADSRTDDRDPHDWFDRTIGPWRFGIELGSGGHGRVFRATSADGTSAAVKVLSVSGDDLSARLEREVAALGGLDHPGIVRVLDHGVVEMAVESDDRTVAYLAMDLVDGGEGILDWIARVRPDRGTRIDLVERLLEPLAHAHARGVVHRDLKSSNILVDDDGRPHVIDFGIARIVDGDGRGTGLHATETRDRHAIVGSLAHLAPEQVDRRLGPISPATDVHAIGLLAYRMLCGEPPYDATGSVVQAIQAVLHVPPADPVIFDPEMPRDLADWLLACLAKDPDTRPGDAGFALSMLRAARRQPNDSPMPGHATGGGHGTRVAVAVMSVVAITAAAIVAATAFRGGDIDNQTDPSINQAVRQESDAGDTEMKLRPFLGAVVGGAMVSGSVCAQDAVQWRVEDGGNGHWYTVRAVPQVTWIDANIAAKEMGANLVSIGSASENSFVFENCGSYDPAWGDGIQTSFGPWIGGIEANGEWTWSDGTVWSYANWADYQPSGKPDNTGRAHFHNMWTEFPAATWNDIPEDAQLQGYVIEWSADCNNDGIVDYGQILDGTFADDDGNGVPDICEVTIFDDYETAILTSEPIAYWRMNIEGGLVENMIDGSPAAVVVGMPGTADSPVGCLDDSSIDSTGGSHLNAGDDGRFDLSSTASMSVEVWIRRAGIIDQPAFVLSQGRDIVTGGWDLLVYQNDIGLSFRVNVVGPGITSSDPIDVDRWVHVVGVIDDDRGITSLYLDGVLDSEVEGGNPGGSSNYPLLIGRHNAPGPWDWPFNGSIDEVAIYHRALSPDEILSHYLSADPDKACTPPCVGNFTNDEVVDAADLGILLAVWGDATAYPEADLNGDGAVDAADLGMLLGAWGPCPD